MKTMDYATMFNNGTAVAMLIFFIYFTTTTLRDNTKAINNNSQIIRELKEDIKNRK